MFRIKFAAAFAALLAIVVALPGVTATPSTANAAQSVPGAYIVVLKDGADADAEAGKAAKDHGAVIDHVYKHALNGYAFRGSARAAAALAKNPNVEFVSEDRVVEAIGKAGDGPSITAAQTTPTGVRRIGGDSSSALSGNGSGAVDVAVAVIDTGSGPHPDLNIAGGKNCSTGKSYNDGNGHGTHVAGTIAAKDDSAGVVGVAPGARIYSVRVLNNAGSGTWSSVICGIDWVTANAGSVKVASMSLGGSGTDAPSDANCNNANNDAMHKAICKSVKAGITYVVAAGNDNVNFSAFVPAAYDEVLTVTAIADFDGSPGGGAAATCRADVDETPADFSNFTTAGSLDEGHTIAAPGVCILSTWKGGGYNTISGTSMATPHVSGVAALCIARDQSAGGCQGMTPPQVIQKLRSDAATKDSANTYGFAGDPNSGQVAAQAYGYLVWAGGY